MQEEVAKYLLELKPSVFVIDVKKDPQIQHAASLHNCCVAFLLFVLIGSFQCYKLLQTAQPCSRIWFLVH